MSNHANKTILSTLLRILINVFLLLTLWHLFKLFGKRTALSDPEEQGQIGYRPRKMVESKVVEK